MSLKDKVFATPISELGLAQHVLRALEERFRARFRDKYGKNPIQPFTVGNIVDLMLPYTIGYKTREGERAFLRVLLDCGLTRVDVPFLPQSTVTEEVLLSIPKEELLELPALTLDIDCKFLYAALVPFMEANLLKTEDIPAVTIREWLNLFGTKDKRLIVNVSRKVRAWKNFVLFQEFMSRLNLTDFMFLRLGTVRDELDYLTDKKWHTYRQAQMITDYCLGEGFIPPFIK